MLTEEWQQSIAGTAAFHIERVAQNITLSAIEHQRPSAVFRPALSMDGNEWCALYGANLQDGVSGFGKSPAEAMDAFDAAWRAPIVQKRKCPKAHGEDGDCGQDACFRVGYCLALNQGLKHP